MDKRLTARDLSPDQREVHEAMMTWSAHALLRQSMLLTIGGLAGCLSGETEVRYNRASRVGSRRISLRDLYLKFNGYSGGGRGAAQRWADLTMPTFLHSLWADGSVSRNRVVAVFESGVKPVLRIDFVGGRHLVLTEDHPIAMPDGRYVQAGRLIVGDAVLGCGTLRPAKGEGRRIARRPPRFIVNTRHHPTGAFKAVECNGVVYEYMRVSRARLVVEAAMNDVSYEEFVRCLKQDATVSAAFRYLPHGVDVHHVNEDTLDDRICNLKVLPRKEHARLHGEENERNWHKDYVREVKVARIRRAGTEMTYDVQMEPPANNFVANGIVVHNTGKTTLLGVYAATTRLRVAYCAFTGRASSVLTRKLRAAGAPSSLRATTIHGLIYQPMVDPVTEEVRGWRKRTSLRDEFDLIVIDEASMVGGSMLADLQAYEVPILAVGDHGQLPPVADSGDLMKAPDLRLEKIHRQAEDNPIIQMAHRVRTSGELDGFEDGDRITFGRKDDFAHHFTGALHCLGYGYHELDLGVLCWANKNRVRLNSIARKALGYRGPPKGGEVVICLRNIPPVYNGMRGFLRGNTIEGTRPWFLQAEITFPDEGLEGAPYILNAAQFNREKTFDTLEELQERGIEVKSVREAGALFDFGYALTVHKSQGSGFQHAIFYLDRQVDPESEDWRRFAYTAITRSAEKLTVLQ